MQVYNLNAKVETKKLEQGEKPWSIRKLGIIDSIRNHAYQFPTLVGLQETLQDQVEDLKRGLGDDWEYFGVGRDDGKTQGEYNPIFYQKNQWDLITNHTCWLSETPDVPSKGWDAKYNRIVSVTTFENTDTNERFNYLNTHFSAFGSTARNHSAELVLKFIRNLNNSYPTFLSGDFNNGKDDYVYKTITSNLTDSSTSNRTTSPNGFGNKELEIIDFIFYSSNEDNNCQAVSYNMLSSHYNLSYFSDHRPIASVFSV